MKENLNYFLAIEAHNWLWRSLFSNLCKFCGVVGGTFPPFQPTTLATP